MQNYFLTMGVSESHSHAVYGDLWLGSLVDGDLPLFNGRGELLVFNGDEWISVCADTFSYFEAQVACTQVFYPFFSNLYSIER